MDFMQKHITNDIFDRKSIYIKDRLNRVIFDEIEALGFEHVFDNWKFLINEINNTLKSSFIFWDDNFILMEKYKTIQKAKERIFELLCSFRILFEHLGRFSLEYSSVDDMKYYLIYKVKQIYRLIDAEINKEDEIIKITVNKDILHCVLSTYLPLRLRKERIGLIVFDDTKSPVLKVKKQIKEKFTTYESKEETIENKKIDIKSELIPYCIIITLSLAKKNQVKLVSFVEDFEKNIDVEELEKLLDLYDNKVTKVIFNSTLAQYLNSEILQKCLCKKCVKKYENNKFIIKDFAQKLNLKKCDECDDSKNVFTYTLI